MSTFLQLVNDVARESGTVPPTIATVVGQVGRVLKVVNWTARAWEQIQNQRPDWKFRYKEFSGKPTVALQARYTAAAWGLTDWSSWKTDRRAFTIYDPAIGVSDERDLELIDYDVWRITFGRGQQTPNYPRCFAVSPAGEICLGPIPDKIYSIQGEERIVPQLMAVDGAIPICPADFHQTIVWKACHLLAQHDEALVSVSTAAANFDAEMVKLEHSQLPTFSENGNPIA